VAAARLRAGTPAFPPGGVVRAARDRAADRDRASSGRSGTREHYWDVARGLLMLLGIPYHAAMPYRAGQEWIVTAPSGSIGATILADGIHLFRMPVFFVVAGYFAAMLLARRDPRAWFRARLLRLGVPFLAALVFIVPLLNLACELANYPLRQALASMHAELAAPGGYWIRHLWFVIVLLYFSGAAAAAATWFPGLATAAPSPARDARIARHAGLALVVAACAIGAWEAVSVELFYKAGFATRISQEMFRLDETLIFAPFFALGCLLQRFRRTLDAVCRPSLAVGVLAATAIAGTLALQAYGAYPPLARLTGTVAALACGQVILSAARTWFDRPSPWVDRIVRASFVIYLVHMPIVIMLFLGARALALPVGLAIPAIALGALAASYALWLVVERVPVLRFLFNGERRR
jgi:glucan biosynthesis protein C